MLSMDDVVLADKRVMIREDYNVPLKEGKVADDTRIKASLPTLQKALSSGAKILVVSHLGRPKEGEWEEKSSLAPVAECLQSLVDAPVRFARDWIEGAPLGKGTITLGENVRFLAGEGKDDPVLAQKLAALCDVFVMDAFATAHRAQASTHGVILKAPIACAGPLFLAEVQALAKVMQNPEHPLVAVVGGAKVSTKMGVLESLLSRVETLVVGGAMANTFLLAEGLPVGTSLAEKDKADDARRILQRARNEKKNLLLPMDVIIGSSPEGDVVGVKNIGDVGPRDMILDIGPRTALAIAEEVARARTILWNGPLGVIENPHFRSGTQTVAEAISMSNAFSVAGGGETLEAISLFGIADKLSYISTAGGAFLEFIEGKTLPAIEALETKGKG